ncbi:MAG: dihydroorotase [Deltaproteobacteria bacterium]|nr:dihydroorotase [Candidatus Anaeroferrophillacea bacterium]
MKRLLIRGGRLIDPSCGRDEVTDLLLVDGKVAEIGPPAVGAAADREIDATGGWVIPGAIDMHVHLREPGQEYKETIRTGAEAAAAGGFTGVACMANTVPVNDHAAVTRFILERAATAPVRVYPVGAVTRGLAGKQLVDMGEMIDAGVAAFSDDGRTVVDSALLRHAFEYAAVLGRTIICHCQDDRLFGGGVMHEGRVSASLGLPGIPAIAEEVDIDRCIRVAEYVGAPLHIAHVGTRGAVAIIAAAKARGVAVTAEVTPHHLMLDHRAVHDLYYFPEDVHAARNWPRRFNTWTKMSPPLREPEDVVALRRALAEGVIDTVATDHAPHEQNEKEVEFASAPFGVVGLETALPLVLALVREGVLTPARMVDCLSGAPARILGLAGRGSLAPGMDADVTVIDPGCRWVVEPERFRSRARNTPFAGWRVQGRAAYTVVAGEVVYAAAGAS